MSQLFRKGRSADGYDRLAIRTLALLEPRRVGRPPIKQVESDETRQIAQLEATVEELARQVEVAGVRREIAQILPHVIKTAEPPGKKTAARPRRPR